MKQNKNNVLVFFSFFFFYQKPKEYFEFIQHLTSHSSTRKHIFEKKKYYFQYINSSDSSLYRRLNHIHLEFDFTASLFLCLNGKAV